MAHPMVGLAKWLSRAEWQEELAEVVAEHIGAACADEEVDIEELEEVIGNEAFIAAWGAACEDLLTRELKDGRNVAENYLKRRGWKESPANREYIQALRNSVISLYEVIEVEPGKHFTLRDLIRGGEPVQVDEPDRSRQMQPGELVGARVFRVRQRTRVSESILVYSPEAAETIQEGLVDLAKELRAQAPHLAAELGQPGAVARLEDMISPGAVLGAAAPLFTDRWLREAFELVFDTPLPRIVNSDGEAMELATAVYALCDGVTDTELHAALSALPCIESAPPPDHAPLPDTGESRYDGWLVTWHWIDDTAEPDPDAIEEGEDEDGTMRLDPRSVSGLPVLGDLARKGDSLRLAANTKARLERGRASLEPALAGLVGPPVIEVQSMADFVREIFALSGDEDGAANDDRPG